MVAENAFIGDLRMPLPSPLAGGSGTCRNKGIENSAHHNAAKAGAITPRYRDALQLCFGAAWKEGHERVKAWAARRKQP